MSKTISKISALEILKGKNVFVFDTETTGLPMRAPGGWGSYWEFNLNDKYDSSRIVSIAWSSIKDYDREHIDSDAIEYHIRYPEGFKDIPTSHIHGITIHEALKNGIPFGLILDNGGLGAALLNAEYIVAHNVGFDYHILMNELYRLTIDNDNVTNNNTNTNNSNIPISLRTREMAYECIMHLINLKVNKKVICTGEISTPICKMGFPTKNNYLGKKETFKMPKMSELYKFYYGKEFENAHSANGDVKALLEIMKCL